MSENVLLPVIEEFDAETQSKIEAHFAQLKRLRGQALLIRYQAGCELRELHITVAKAGQKGRFAALMEDYGYPRQAAYEDMQLADFMDKFVKVNQLSEIRQLNAYPTTLSRLGVDGVPQKACKEVAKLLLSGEKLRGRDVDEIIAKHNGKPPARGEGGQDAPRGASAPPPTAEVPLVVDGPIEGELCPNCEENEVWVYDPAKDCYACRRCGHPRGEPVGDKDENTKAWKPPKQDEPPKKPTKAAAIKGIRDALQEVYRHALDDVAPEYGLNTAFVARTAYTGNVFHVLDQIQKDLINWK